MNGMSKTALVGLALVVAVTGCRSSGKNRTQSSFGAIELANNLAGDPCRAEPKLSGSIEELDNEPFSVFCGDWNQPAGQVIAMAPSFADGNADRKIVEDMAKASWWRQSLERRLSCDAAGKWRDGLGGDKQYFLNCKMLKGGWPFIAFGALREGRVYLADGVPGALPALDSAISWVTDPDAPRVGRDGGEEVEEGEVTAADDLKRLEALLGKAGGVFGANDLNAYQNLIKLGQIYNSKKDFKAAEAAYRQALAIHENVFGANNPESGDALISLALEVSNQGRWDEAKALFNQAEPLVNISADRSDFARYLSYRALDAANRRDYSSAVEYSREATKVRKEIVEAQEEAQLEANQFASALGGGGGPSRGAAGEGEIAQSRYIEAAMLMRLGNLEEAELTAVDADNILKRAARAPGWWVAQIQNLLGQIRTRLGRFDDAEQNLRRAIDIRESIFGRTKPMALSTMALADLYAAQGRLQESLDAYRQAVEIAQEDSTVSGAFVFARLVPYLDALMRAGKAFPEQSAELYDEAFRVSQLVEQSVTSQTIAATAARLASSDPKVGALVRQLQEATRIRDEVGFELGLEQQKTAKRKNVTKIAKLQGELAEAAQDASLFEQQLQQAYPAYSELVSTDPVTVEALNRSLRSNEALAYFAIGEEASFLFLIHNGRVFPRRLPVNKRKVDETVAVLREAFQVRSGRVLEFELSRAHQFYNELFGGLESELANANLMLIVANGSLLSFPFGLLVTEPAGAGGKLAYTQASWLATKMASSMVPSVRSFINLRRLGAAQSAPDAFIGFGNPIYRGVARRRTPPALGALPFAGVRLAAYDPSGGGGPIRTRSAELFEEASCGADGAIVPRELLAELAPLPETADELRQIVNVIDAPGTRLVLDEDVNEFVIKEIDLSRYRIVYFATHGLLPGELLCQTEPALAVTPPAARGEVVEEGALSSIGDEELEDGLLSSSEIAQLELNADLVVLSACNTGGPAGKMGGEALSGLARSFFYAGARALMVTHWQVPSEATVRLTTGMFRRIGQGLDLSGAEALRLSQLEMIKNPEFSHPVFWGAFTLVGDGGKRLGAILSSTERPRGRKSAARSSSGGLGTRS